MTVTQIQTRILERLGESAGTPVFYTLAETLEALNAAQRFFVLLSLCLESKTTFALAPGQIEARMLTLFADFILPLRLQAPDIDGNLVKLQPGSVQQFTAANDSWRTETADFPAFYAVHGFDYGLFYPAPAGAITVTITYARGPVALTAGGDVPEIPEEYQPDLVDAAMVLLRLKEGGQEFAKELIRWKKFMGAVAECAGIMRTRNRAAGYDKEPIERTDRSRA